jgi:hypothetical protein
MMCASALFNQVQTVWVSLLGEVLMRSICTLRDQGYCLTSYEESFEGHSMRELLLRVDRYLLFREAQ